jgi:hypothetical protein
MRVRRSTFNDTEWRLYKQGKCCYQTGYGLPWTTYCGRRLSRKNPWGYCKRHAREIVAMYGDRAWSR